MYTGQNTDYARAIKVLLLRLLMDKQINLLLFYLFTCGAFRLYDNGLIALNATDTTRENSQGLDGLCLQPGNVSKVRETFSSISSCPGVFAIKYECLTVDKETGQTNKTDMGTFYHIF